MNPYEPPSTPSTSPQSTWRFRITMQGIGYALLAIDIVVLIRLFFIIHVIRN